MLCKHPGCNAQTYNDDVQYCHKHGGHAHAANIDRKKGLMFKIETFRARAEEFKADDRSKNIHDEVALLRAMMESFVNTINQNGMSEFIAAFPGVRDTISTIARLVETCHKIEVSQERHIAIDELQSLLITVVQIIVKYVPDKEVVAKIKDEIFAALAEDKDEES